MEAEAKHTRRFRNFQEDMKFLDEIKLDDDTIYEIRKAISNILMRKGLADIEKASRERGITAEKIKEITGIDIA